MQLFKRIWCAFCACFIAAGMAAGAMTAEPSDVSSEAHMPAIIQHFSADERSLDRTYPISISPVRIARFEKFYADTQARLTEIDFDSLSHEDQIDYLLLKNLVTSNQHQLAIKKKQIDRDAVLAALREDDRRLHGNRAVDAAPGRREGCGGPFRDGEAD